MKALGIGEVLLDLFSNGDATVGGAPLNVTFHLNQLMNALGIGEARFASRVGRDAAGERILKYLQSAGMDVSFVSVDERLPTGNALVFTDAGQAGFEIAQNVAWDAIEGDLGVMAFAQSAASVVFGSLAQREEASRETIRRVVEAVRGDRLYDINLRRNTRSGIAGYTEEIIRSSLRLATVVKLNDSEIEEVAAILQYPTSLGGGEERQWKLMSMLAAQFDLAIVALTRGAKGALVLGDKKRYRLGDSSLPQDQVHPVGAGDAFAAGLLFGRMQGWDLAFSLELADLMATWVVQHVGATPALSQQLAQQIFSLSGRAGTSPIQTGSLA